MLSRSAPLHSEADTVAGSVLQRKCGCGGTASNCDCAQHAPTALPQPKPEPQALLQVPENTSEEEDIYDGTVIGDSGSSPTQQADDNVTPNAADLPPGVTSGSGAPLCANGGGSSACDLSSGNYVIQSNDNTCCTQDCTQQHEARHVKDVTGWGCCKKAADAYAAATGNASPAAVRATITDMYNRWIDQARPITECNAYRNDVKCATALEKSKHCSGSGKDSACCLSISSYKSKYADEANKYCKAAPAKVPPCPNFDLAASLS